MAKGLRAPTTPHLPRKTQVRQAGLMGFGPKTHSHTQQDTATYTHRRSIWTWTFLRCDFT